MFNKILVPLDGSELAERALKPALKIAQHSEAEIILLRVPLPETMLIAAPHLYGGYDLMYPSQALNKARQEVKDYLDQAQQAAARFGLNARIKTPEGNVAEAIMETAIEEHVELIVMSSHGYSGITRWVLGSVAEKVLGNAPCPVLIVRSTQSMDKALITLDGSEVAESAIKPGLDVAMALSREVTLLRVAEEVHFDELTQLEIAEHGLGARLQEELYREADTYLQSVAEANLYDELTMQTLVRIGAPTGQILEFAETHQAGLIVMATHGRTGLRRWVYGSVTEKVLRGFGGSMLVIRPK
ncbi:MAG: universal stress protein [Chloroflexi bacterium]|nr:universal stress protein [Chloroflexota bacterium]